MSIGRVDLGEGFWNFNIETKKRGVQACAFVGPETTRLLEQFKNKTGQIFNTKAKSAVKMLNTIIRRVNVEGVSAHGLRKYFVTSMEHARVPEQYYLHMMGKKSSVYSEKRRSELLKEYKRAYPELSIYIQQAADERFKRQKKDIEELKDLVKSLQKRLDDEEKERDKRVDRAIKYFDKYGWPGKEKEEKG